MTELPSTKPQASVVIKTSRLRLRSYRDDDLTDIVVLAGNWQVARWLSHLPHPYSEVDGREWIARVKQQHEAGRPRSFAIALKESDRLIGGAGIDGTTISGGDAEELGYWIGEPYWGRGYGREAVAAIIDYGFRVLGLQTIEAYTDPSNAPSQKVLLACGLQKAGEIELVKPTRHGALRAPLFGASQQNRPIS
jgi:ribosomal-protein-alanine N-acetyltransferase